MNVISLVQVRGRMNIVNRERIPQTNYVMDTLGVYKFDFGLLVLFGLQNDFIGLLQRMDLCGPSIDCMQPLVYCYFWSCRGVMNMRHVGQMVLQVLYVSGQKGVRECNCRNNVSTMLVNYSAQGS